MRRLVEIYKQQVVPKMKERLGYKNNMEVPKISKVIVNIGIGPAIKEPKMLDIMIKDLIKITGQKPIQTKAKHAISGFNIREGMVVGLKVTLRKARMYDFLERFINIVLPNVRDFKGLSKKGFDGHGNYTVGIKEQVVFPELRTEEITRLHGLEININTTAKTKEETETLFRFLGFPIAKDN